MERSTSTVCSIQMYGSDEIRLIDMPPELLRALRTAITGVQSIQWEGVHPNNERSWKIKLLGNPWSYRSGAAGVVKSARLILKLLECMLSRGWGLELAMNPQSHSSHDSWFFSMLEQSAGRSLSMCCIVFSNNDKIRVIDGNREVSEAVRSTISTFWEKGLQGETVNYGAEEFQLRGYPWSSSKGTTKTVFLLAKLIGSLKIVGWDVFVSTAHRFKSDDGDAPVSNKWILTKVRT